MIATHSYYHVSAAYHPSNRAMRHSLSGLTVNISEMHSQVSLKALSKCTYGRFVELVDFANMTAQDRLKFSTTLINTVWSKVRSTASGFFFAEYDCNQGVVAWGTQSWRECQEVWLVTNRHVLVNDDDELAKMVEFSVRQETAKGFTRLPISISKTGLENRCKFHREDKVDVAIIQIHDLLKNHDQSGNDRGQYVHLETVRESMLPSQIGIMVGAGDEIRIVGFPRGFYDKENDFPIVKSGVIASRWGDFYRDAPCFLIDAKLFPGSSGSLVISKPTVELFKNGQLYVSQSGLKEYAFLGVFSANLALLKPATTASALFYAKNYLDIGTVWYNHVVPEIVSDGISFREMIASNS